MFSDAVEVLLNNIRDVQRAAEFAEKINIPEVWSKIGYVYLELNRVVESIDCFIKAQDHSAYITVIYKAELENLWNDLVRYLLMARNKHKDANIDNSLSFSYAKLNKLVELENFVNGNNSADIQRVGDRCFEDKLYEAAKILFVNFKNNAKIASCLVRLK